MSKIKVYLALLGAVIVTLLAVSLILPARYRVERRVVIDAKAKDIFPLLNTLKKWPAWTAWTKERDPSLTVNFEGPEEGVGAVYRWTGDQLGVGRLKITRSDPARGMWYDLDFEDGKYLSQGGITFETAGEGTEVIWYNGGDLGRNPIQRYFGLFMDRMTGPDFEAGLGNLKRIVEANRK
jgi:hypothetical protein